MGAPRMGYVVIGFLAVLLTTQLATATVAPVGLLESVDVEIVQGAHSLFHFTNVSTVGKLSGQQIHLGDIGTDTSVWLEAVAYDPTNPLVEDRLMQYTIRGRNLAGTAPANLFDASDEGDIQVKLTNMKFSNVDGVSDTRVTPFNPNQYPYDVNGQKPFFYMLDENQGFVNLRGSEQYSPAGAGQYNLWMPSVQVPLYVWQAAYGYGFNPADSGFRTGFELSGIEDFGGTGPTRDGALALTPVTPGSPYFGPTSVPEFDNRGFVSEIGISLNMRGYTLPEPATLALILVPLIFMSRSRKRAA